MQTHQAAIERVSRYFHDHTDISYAEAVTYLKLSEFDNTVKISDKQSYTELTRICMTYGLTNVIAAIYFCEGNLEARDYWLEKYKSLFDY